MESFKWGQQFVTGIQDIDDQHRKLVAMINALGEVIADNAPDKTLLLTMFEDLYEYANDHFRCEKRLMDQVRIDPRHVEAHVLQHGDFAREIRAMAESLDRDLAENSRMLLQFLIHWLAFHILGTDRNMARQVAEVGRGTDPKEAFEHGETDHNPSTEPLVKALNGLFAIISRRNKELLALNKTLEKRVAERTEKLVKANEDLQKLAITDHLTELPNRRFVMGQLQLLFEEAALDEHPLSCLMIDVDGFKEINDSYGHDVGDRVLKQLALTIKHSVRSDDIVCRLGGDEFIIVCPDTALPGAMHVGEQIREKVSSLEIETGQGPWTGSISIGVSCTTQGISDAKALLKAADEALFKAKRYGRNCVIVH